MANEKLKVGLIGTGMIATTAHLPGWRNLHDEVEVVAVADIAEGRAKWVAEKHGISRAYGDWKQMLAQERLDIVSICTPNAYHMEQAIGALKAGAHVLCEKPVATSYADAKKMFDAAEAAKRVLFVGQSARFTPRSWAAKEIIDAGRLGEIYHAETYFMRRRGVPTWGQFHMKKHSGGGPVYDLGVHALDLLLWLMGSPRVVAVSGATYRKLANRKERVSTSLAESGAPMGVMTPSEYHPEEYDVEDLAAAFFRLEGGATIAFRTSWAANIPANTGGTSILGTEGGLVLDPLTLVTNLGNYPVNVSPVVPAERAVEFAAHWEETAHFVRVIQGKETLVVKREEVLNVMRALDGVYASSESGREVAVGG